MFYNVLKIKDLINLDGEKVAHKVLMENDSRSLSIVALKKDEFIDTHSALSDAAVIVIDGEIEMHFNAEKFTVDKGEILMFKKDNEHKVLALKDSKFFILKI